MPRARDTKVWNEDLVRALRARQELCIQQGSPRQYMWRDGALLIEGVRTNIYAFKTGRIVGLPDKELSKTVRNECEAIIRGTKPILPPGYVAVPREELQQMVPAGGNPYDNDPYLNKIKGRGGAYAILLAFHYSAADTLTKEQICRAAQPYCDEQMKESFRDGRQFGAWKSKDTLVKHGLLTEHKTNHYGNRGWAAAGPGTWTITQNGRQFTQALLRKFRLDGQTQNNNFGGVGMNDLPLQGMDLNAPHNLFGTAHRAAIRGAPAAAFLGAAGKGNRNHLAENDEQEFRDWLATAQPGDHKRFRVGKERRKLLHHLCQEAEVRNPGLRLRHESDGLANARALIVTLESKGNAVFVAPIGNQSLFLPDDIPSFESGYQLESSTEQFTPAFVGSGNALQGDVAGVGVSPREAALNAALLRQAMNESQKEYERSVAKSTSTEHPLTTLDNNEILTAVMIESEMEYKRSAAKNTPTDPDNNNEILSAVMIESEMEYKRSVAKNTPTEHPLMDLDNNNDEILSAVMNESKKEYERSVAKLTPTKRPLMDLDNNENLSAVRPESTMNDRKPAAIHKARSAYGLDNNDDEDEEDDMIRAAKKRSLVDVKMNEEPTVVDLNDSHEHPSHQPFNQSRASKPADPDEDDIIDLADSQESFVPGLYPSTYFEGKTSGLSSDYDDGHKASHTEKADNDDDDIIDLADSQESFVPGLYPQMHLERKTSGLSSDYKSHKATYTEKSADDDDDMKGKTSSDYDSHKASYTRKADNDDDDIIDLADSQESFVPGLYPQLHLEGKTSGLSSNYDSHKANYTEKADDGGDDEDEMEGKTSELSSYYDGHKARYTEKADKDDDEIIDLADSQNGFVPGLYPPMHLEGKTSGLSLDDDSHKASYTEKANGKDDDYEMIDLADSQESAVLIDNAVLPAVHPLVANETIANDRALTILIDNRERTRNATPRTLRIELTRNLQAGALKSVWPPGLPLAEVVEQRLNYGDFAFVLAVGSNPPKRLPLTIERKRVADLVQRSVKGDHWKQLQQMRDCCRCAVLLIEGDTRTARRFTAYGSQNREEWNPAYHCIDDEESLYRFVGRAILSSRAIKFFQAKDEQATHRAVGALGIMAALSEEHEEAPQSTLSATDAQTELYDRLIKAGVPWELGRRVADEIGSIKQLDILYAECSNDACRSALLCQVIASVKIAGSASSIEDWSDAIFRAYFSVFAEPTKGRQRYDEHKHLVENHAVILSAMHTEQDDQTAIAIALTAEKQKLPPRRVAIELTEKLSPCFEAPTEESFYTLAVTAPEDENSPIQTIVMQTHAGNLTSHRLFIHVVPAKLLVETVQHTMSLNGDNFVGAARRAAEKLNRDCKAPNFSPGLDRRVILFQGMVAAYNAAASQRDYREEVRVVMDMVMAELTWTHDVVVLQALRQMVEDLSIMLRQLALACLHYHFLTQEKV